MSSGHDHPISFAAWTFMLEVEAFIEQLGEELEAEQLDRAWQITLGCVEIHAQVDFDEEEDETLEHAESLVWHDLWQAFESEPATFTLWGLREELLLACGDDAHRLEAFIQEAGRRALLTDLGSPQTASADAAPPAPTHHHRPTDRPHSARPDPGSPCHAHLTLVT